MFIVNFEDGSCFAEGRDVDCWDDVPRDRRILSVTLTAGGDLSHTISGYEGYIVQYEAVARLENVVCDSLIDPEWMVGREPKVVGQTCVAVQHFPEWIRELQAQWGAVKNQLQEEVRRQANMPKTDPDESKELKKPNAVATALMREYNQLDARMNEAMRKIKSKEISIFTLGFSGIYKSEREYPVRKEALRVGVPEMVGNLKPEDIAAQLSPKPKKGD
jgi:uncharacterized protein YdcH (DUF465 family)